MVPKVDVPTSLPEDVQWVSLLIQHVFLQNRGEWKSIFSTKAFDGFRVGCAVHAATTRAETVGRHGPNRNAWGALTLAFDLLDCSFDAFLSRVTLHQLT